MPKQPCRNCPSKWAQDRWNLCRACLRQTGDRRTTREIQRDEARPRRGDSELAMTWAEAEAIIRGEVPPGVQDACIGIAMDMRGYR